MIKCIHCNQYPKSLFHSIYPYKILKTPMDNGILFYFCNKLCMIEFIANKLSKSIKEVYMDYENYNSI